MLTLSQESYIKKTLILLRMNEIILASTSEILDKYYEINKKEVFTEESHKYLQLISNIMYEMTQTCSDYAFQISHLASFSWNHSSKHWGGTKQLMRYICGMADY